MERCDRPAGLRSSGTRTLPRLAVTLLFILGAAGCIRRDGRNSDCHWPPENAPHAATPRHLSADAEFAEDLAIRYADVHHGLRTPYYISGEDYTAARDRCMETLFEQIAREHAVPVEQVSNSLGRNRGYIDLAETLPFVVFYVFVVAVVARLNWRRYSPDEQGWTPGIIMTLFLSLAFALGATMVGEMSFWMAESYRMGNAHMSLRADRLFWVRHRRELFAGAVIVFWLAAIEAARHLPSDRLTGT